MIVFIFVILQLVHSSQTQGDWRVIETTAFDWNKSANPQAFIIETRRNEEFRVRIQTPGQADLIVLIRDGLAQIKNDAFVKDLVSDNLLNSSYLYITPRLTDLSGKPMLLVFGAGLASNAASLNIIALDREGVPAIVFTSEEFALTAIKDVDGDGQSELVGQHCLSQVVGEDITTYDPTSVYRFNRRTGKAVFSLALSRAYNLKNYAWAGPECSEKIVIVRWPSKDKPRVMSAERALRLDKKRRRNIH